MVRKVLFVLLVAGLTVPSSAQILDWTQKFPSASPPTPRLNYTVAYDSARSEVVLFGGATLTAAIAYNDTWVWDGVGWAQRFPPASPPARTQHSAAYDVARSQLVVFGGLSPIGIVLNDTWVWDGTSWTQKFPLTSPPHRVLPTMAYDSAHSEVVMFGGSDNVSVRFADTWIWDGTNWAQQFPASSPPARVAHVMAYDASRTQVVLFGGLCGQWSSR